MNTILDMLSTNVNKELINLVEALLHRTFCILHIHVVHAVQTTHLKQFNSQKELLRYDEAPFFLGDLTSCFGFGLPSKYISFMVNTRFHRFEQGGCVDLQKH